MRSTIAGTPDGATRRPARALHGAWRVLAALAFSAAAGARAGEGALEDADAAVAQDAPEGSGEAADDSRVGRVAQLGIEELMQLEVAIVAGTPQRRGQTPAAITVITAEEIRRSGHRTLAEVLRLVPGMFVGRAGSRSWIVGARGLAGSTLTANRHLVLVDGRVVHDPLFSGTFWDATDVVLEDIERIEVIRGPGATLWGVNAMNGVISVVTRHARDTQGTLLRAGVGTQGQRDLLLRHGAGGPAQAYRGWIDYRSHGAFDSSQGGSMNDHWSSLRTGVRIDGLLDQATEYMAKAEAYTLPRAMALQVVPVPGRHREFDRYYADDEASGASAQFRIGRQHEGGAGWHAQAYIDYSSRELRGFGLERRTVDVDYRRWRHWGERHELVWGAQYLWTGDHIQSSPFLLFERTSRTWSSLNAFVQDTIELVPGRWYAMVGSKLTHHSFVDLQLQPSARVWWTPDTRHMLWAAVSRPVRVPSRLEVDGMLVLSYEDTGLRAGGPASGEIVPVGISGDEDLQAERLLAWELGHRVQFGEWALDTSVYYNDYTRLIGVPPDLAGSFTDAARGHTRGADVALSGRLSPHWRIESSISWMDVEVSGPIFEFEEESHPRYMAQLHSYLDLTERLELNAAAYRVDRIPRLDVEAHTRLDLGLTWRPHPGLELSLWGRNLLEEGHREAHATALVPRSVQLLATVHLGR